MRMRHILICGLSDSTIFLPSLSQTRHDFRKKKKMLLNTKCAFWFSLQLPSETFLILRRTERDMIKNLYWVSQSVARSSSAVTPLSVRLPLTILKCFCSVVTNNFAIWWYVCLLTKHLLNNINSHIARPYCPTGRIYSTTFYTKLYGKSIWIYQMCWNVFVFWNISRCLSCQPSGLIN
jgi:hypothetical protein